MAGLGASVVQATQLVPAVEIFLRFALARICSQVSWSGRMVGAVVPAGDEGAGLGAEVMDASEAAAVQTAR